MSKFASFVVVVLLLLLVGLFLANSLANSETNRLNAEARLEYERGRARATILEAQGQARLDSAIAVNLVLMSALPIMALTVLGLLGLAVVVLVAYLPVRARPAAPRIEYHVLYFPQPGWDDWQLSDGQADNIISLHRGITQR